MVPAIYKSRSRHETLTLRVEVYPVVIEELSPAFLKRKLCIVFPDCGCTLHRSWGSEANSKSCKENASASLWFRAVEEDDVGFLGNSAHYTVQQCAAVRH